MHGHAAIICRHRASAAAAAVRLKSPDFGSPGRLVSHGATAVVGAVLQDPQARYSSEAGILRCNPCRSMRRYKVVRSTPATRAALDMFPPASVTSCVR